jgi:hypothetical protein
VSPAAAALAARLAALTPPCPRCGAPQTPAAYCAADDSGACIPYVSRPLTPAEAGTLIGE